MLAYTADQIVGSFQSAPNVNAALKKFLKKEVRRGDPIERFTKDLRSAIASKKTGALGAFIEESLPEYEPHLLVISRYLYFSDIEVIIEGIYTRHAENFNATYEHSDSGFTYKDEHEFERIAREAIKEIDQGISERKLPDTPFMRSVILGALFDNGVIEEVVRKVEG